MIIGRISNRTLFLVIFLLAAKSLAGQHPVDEKPGYLDESNYYAFYSHYWLNLHHFLQQEALTNQVSKKSTVSEAVWKKMSGSDPEEVRYPSMSAPWPKVKV